MNKSLIFCVILLVLCTVAVSAEIPSEILDQQIVEWDENQPEGDTRIMLLVNEEENIFNIKTPSVETKLADYRVSSEDELKEIADSFVANSADMLGLASTNLRIRGASLSKIESELDYHNPSGSVWYDQYYNDIPVYAGALGIQINAYGMIYQVDYRLLKDISAPTEAAVTSEETVAKAAEYYGQDSIKLTEDPKLYIIQNKLAWRLNIDSPVGKEAFFEADTGDFLTDRPNVAGEESPVPTLYDDAGTDSTPAVTGGEIEPSGLEDAVKGEADAAKDNAKPVVYIIAAIVGLLVILAITMFIVRKIKH